MRYGVLTMVLAAVLIGASQAHAASEVADAAMRGDQAALREALRENLDVNAPQPDGATALHWAAYRGDVEAARWLIDAGAAPAAANRNGATPLSLACTVG